MDARLQRRVQRYGWDAAARVYESTWRDNLQPAHDLMFELSALKPGDAVVDVACGSGLATFRAATCVGDQGSVVATDISAEMTALVQREADRLAIDTVTAHRMDAEALDLENEQFDVALCALGLMYVPDPTAALREMRRVLRPGGQAVVSVWGARKNCGWADLFPIVDSVVESEVCPLFFGLGAGDGLKTTVETAGFEDVDARRLQFSIRYDSVKAALEAMIDGGAVALAAKRFDKATRDKVDKAFLASIEPYRDQDGRYDIPGEFVVASATRP